MSKPLLLFSAAVTHVNLLILLRGVAVKLTNSTGKTTSEEAPRDSVRAASRLRGILGTGNRVSQTMGLPALHASRPHPRPLPARSPRELFHRNPAPPPRRIPPARNHTQRACARAAGKIPRQFPLPTHAPHPRDPQTFAPPPHRARQAAFPRGRDRDSGRGRVSTHVTGCDRSARRVMEQRCWLHCRSVTRRRANLVGSAVAGMFQVINTLPSSWRVWERSAASLVSQVASVSLVSTVYSTASAAGGQR